MKLSIGIILAAVAVCGCSAVSVPAGPVSNAHLRKLEMSPMDQNSAISRNTFENPDCVDPQNKSSECKNFINVNSNDLTETNHGPIDDYGLPKPFSPTTPITTPTTTPITTPTTTPTTTPITTPTTTTFIIPQNPEPLPNAFASPMLPRPISDYYRKCLFDPESCSQTTMPTSPTYNVPLNPSPQPEKDVLASPMLPVQADNDYPTNPASGPPPLNDDDMPNSCNCYTDPSSDCSPQVLNPAAA